MNMKKYYAAPQSEAIRLCTENHILAESGGTTGPGLGGDGETVGGSGDVGSSRHGWNSDSWGATEED